MKTYIHAGLLSLFVAVTASASSFSAWGDFSSTNPSGAWKYGFVATDGAVGALDTDFSLNPTFQASCVSGQASCWVSSTYVTRPNSNFTSGTVSFVAGYLTLHPSPDGAMSVLAFTAPAPDVYTFAGEWADQDVDGGGGVEIWTALGNGTILAHDIMPWVSNPVAINFSQSLTSGQSVYFVLGYNGDWGFDSTGLKLNVTDSSAPEPGSMLLVGWSAAAVWLKRRVSSR